LDILGFLLTKLCIGVLFGQAAHGKKKYRKTNFLAAVFVSLCEIFFGVQLSNCHNSCGNSPKMKIHQIPSNYC
jgi:hypothetical protein